MTRLSKLSRSIAGKVALVTGAASGMGRATAHLFADEGAHVAVTDINGEGVEAVVAEITEAGLNAKGWTLDLADPERIKAVVGEVADHFGGLDILVNNAGISQHTLIDDDDYEAIWDRHLDILLRAHTRTIRAALPHLRASEGGRIVNIASTEGLGATPETSPYTAGKHGVIGLTRALATEYAKSGVTFNAVCPGFTETDIAARTIDTMVTKAGRTEEEAYAELASLNPQGRLVQPDEVAQ
ncbi:MAG: SDR family oxidoreductase, partial [Rhodospirillaceae bacterium]|nr:SDR family oxidoreductase [Rhodospirillaceae bacterium]